MNDREITRRLRGFESVWGRVRGESAEAGAMPERSVPLMPRRRPECCRNRGRACGRGRQNGGEKNLKLS